MMEEKLCPVCKAPIVCTYRRDDLYYYIEKKRIRRDTNPDLWAEDAFHFHCSNDKEHPVILDSDWCSKFESEIAKDMLEVKFNV